jgi:hypothetical protein
MIRPPRIPLPLLLLCVLAAVPALAQGPRFATFPAAALPERQPISVRLPRAVAGRPNVLGMTLGGLLGAVPGVVAGALVGYEIDRDGGCYSDEWCGLWGALAGATAGSTLLIPAGVHLSNRGRGSFGAGVGWSALVAVAGWTTAIAFDSATPLIILPFAQIVAAVASEAQSTPVPAQ